MSVLNQSGEEQVECPLCMEPLEVDDLNFYPCTCGYQICRFCWHRIRTDENGLCPACRAAYSENPADFTPLSVEQVAGLKAEKRARDQQRKARLNESRKHLAQVRVVQRNLVFVVGLPVRLADHDVLRRHEYFGKFGKIHKVVINQSTSYAGSLGPSASAYVTYVKSDDALRAIQCVNNITLDGRVIKSSLGTTKYCSHFMKNQPCPKADCMYLHDFGDPEASFTKEQMHVGKHQEYEKKLHDSLLTRTQQQAQQQAQVQSQQQQQQVQQQQVQSQQQAAAAGDKLSDKTSDKDRQKGKDWPTLHGDTNNGFGINKTEKQQKTENKSEKSQKKNQKNKNNNNNTNSHNNNIENPKQKSEKEKISKNCEQSSCSANQQSTSVQSKPQVVQSHSQVSTTTTHKQQSPTPSEPLVPITQENKPEKLSKHTESANIDLSKMQLIDDNSSFFSHNCFQKILADDTNFSTESSNVTSQSNILNDNLPDITSSEDWQAAFGFSTNLKSEPHISENGFQQNENGFINHLENFQKSQQNFDLIKTRENILDVLGRNSQYISNNGLNDRINHQNHYSNLSHKPDSGLPTLPNGLPSLPNGLPNLTNGHTNVTNSLTTGLDQQMSKFFAEFNNKNGCNHPTNGFVVDRQNFVGNQINLNENHNMLLLNYQQRMDDQAIYNLKQNVYHNQQQQQQQQQQPPHNPYINNHGTPMHHSGSQQFLQNGSEHYLNQNGHSFGNSGYTPNSLYQNQTLQQRNQIQAVRSERERASVDDDLGFDPFHETQKALAELIESEQGSLQQIQNNGAPRSGNGNVVTSQPHLPPPPPGFMQHNTHMNSFGSKILPFLNMSSSQQIPTSGGGWSNNYSEAQLKGLAPVNDWMTLDPAIVSSSRHFPLANQFPSPLFENAPNRVTSFYPNQSQPHNGYSQQQNPHTQHIPTTSYNTNTHNNSQQSNGLNWYNNDIQSVSISSPPGFRTNTKTQEC